MQSTELLSSEIINIPPKIYYYVYITTNLINNKIYIGVHSSKNKNDSYLGSGIIIKKAIEKYGRLNFKKEILMYFESHEKAYEYENLLVTPEFITNTDHLVYNKTIGGRGGKRDKENGMYNKKGYWLGKKISEETKKKISIANSGKNSYFYGRKGKDNPSYGRKFTEKQLQKRKELSKGENNPNFKYNIFISNLSHSSNEIKNLIKSKYKSLSKFCKIFNLEKSYFSQYLLGRYGFRPLYLTVLEKEFGIIIINNNKHTDDKKIPILTTPYNKPIYNINDLSHTPKEITILIKQKYNMMKTFYSIFNLHQRCIYDIFKNKMGIPEKYLKAFETLGVKIGKDNHIPIEEKQERKIFINDLNYNSEQIKLLIKTKYNSLTAFYTTFKINKCIFLKLLNGTKSFSSYPKYLEYLNKLGITVTESFIK